MATPTTPAEGGEEITTIYCSDLPEDTTDREFANMFRFAIGFERSTVSKSKGFGNRARGFARFTNYQAASDAIQTLDGSIIDQQSGEIIRCSFAKTQLVDEKLISKRPMEEGGFAPYSEPKRLNTGMPRDNFMGHPAFHPYARPSPLTYPPPRVKMPIDQAVVPTDTLHMSNLGPSTTEEELRPLLDRKGFLGMKFLPRPGASICFAKFVDPKAAANAIASLDGIVLRSTGRKPIMVTFARKSLDLSRLEAQPH